MTEVGTTEIDLKDAENRVQARWELDRAMQSSGYAPLSTWAVRWGRSALDALNDPSSDVADSLRDDLNEAENEAASAESRLVDAQDEIKDLEKAMRVAINEMRRVAELIEDEGGAYDAGQVREIANELEGNL